MEKKALQLASVASMIDQFNIPNIQILQSLGYKVDVVADFTNPGNITAERAEDLQNRLEDMNVRVFDIAIPRSINPIAILNAYKKVKDLIKAEHYNLIHCHSPIGGAICRLAAKNERKIGTKVIYTAHGFHFYDGAPIKNWLIFYPIEKHFSRYTDVLITINKEDYKRAKEKFKALSIVYVPGIGIDTNYFSHDDDGRKRIREELGVSDKTILLLSVGELNENKNHELVIRSISGIGNVCYAIVGKGVLRKKLENLAEELNVDLRLMGFRADVKDFYNAADVYVLPSIREGLNVSLMEAMACGLPCAVSEIRGNRDLIDVNQGGVRFDPRDNASIRKSIICIVEKDYKLMGEYNRKKISNYSISNVSDIIKTIYKDEEDKSG